MRYAQKLRNLAAPDHAASDGDLQGRHLDDAMKIVVDKNYCRQCHIVADYVPVQTLRAMGPDLSRVQNRLRPSFLRQWIGKPTSVLPYSAMPVNVPYNPDDPELLGTTVPQQLYHGNSIEQLDALVDLLMNYDSYAKQHAKIAPLVPPTPLPEPVTTSSQ